MNPWIADHLLQTEIESHNRVRDDYLTAARVKRQTEGWISGYIIRTKIHSVANDSTAAGDASMTRGNRGGGYDSMCTICLLELEDGDRVADLPCGHMYHAECLGEWILKRVRSPIICTIVTNTHPMSRFSRFLTMNVNVTTPYTPPELLPPVPGSRCSEGNQILRGKGRWE